MFLLKLPLFPAVLPSTKGKSHLSLALGIMKLLYYLVYIAMSNVCFLTARVEEQAENLEKEYSSPLPSLEDSSMPFTHLGGSV